MGHWASKQVQNNALRSYQAQNNAASLDGLTGLRSARRDNGEILLLTEAKATYRRVTGNAEALLLGTVLGMVIMVVLMVPIGGWDRMGLDGPPRVVHSMPLVVLVVLKLCSGTIRDESGGI